MNGYCVAPVSSTVPPHFSADIYSRTPQKRHFQCFLLFLSQASSSQAFIPATLLILFLLKSLTPSTLWNPLLYFSYYLIYWQLEPGWWLCPLHENFTLTLFQPNWPLLNWHFLPSHLTDWWQWSIQCVPMKQFSPCYPLMISYGLIALKFIYMLTTLSFIFLAQIFPLLPTQHVHVDV